MASTSQDPAEHAETDKLLPTVRSDSSMDDVELVMPSKEDMKVWRPGYDVRRNAYLANHGTFPRSQQQSLVQEETPPIPQMDNPVTRALYNCQQTVLKPYLRILILIGWHPLFREGQEQWRRVLNVLHPVLVVLILLLGYIIQISSCFNREDIPPGPAPTSSNVTPTNNHSDHPEEPVCTPVLISQYIIPDLLHSAAYGFSFFVFRIARSEQLVTLTERVFLQTSQTHSGFLSQAKLIKFMRALFYSGVAWVILSLLSRTLSLIFQHDTISFAFLNPTGSIPVKIILIILMLVAIVMLDIVYVAVVVNYMVQCSLLTYYIEGLMEKLREKTLTLENAMKVMCEIEGHIKELNDHPSTALSIVMFNFMSYFVLGLTDILTANHGQYPWYFYINIGFSTFVLWLTAIVVPLVIAARLSASGNRLRKMGHVIRMRPFGYQATEAQTLDSFLLYTVTINFRAKVMRVPVRTTYLLGLLALIGFILLILFQSGAVSIWMGYRIS